MTTYTHNVTIESYNDAIANKKIVLPHEMRDIGLNDVITLSLGEGQGEYHHKVTKVEQTPEGVEICIE